MPPTTAVGSAKLETIGSAKSTAIARPKPAHAQGWRQRNSAPLARPALQARLAAEQGAEDANASVVERLQTLLSGIESAAAATPAR